MLYLVATPIGNILDITLRALDTLEECNIILCEDTRVTKKLIGLLNSRNLLKNQNFKFISFHSHNAKKRLDEMGVEFFNQKIAFLCDAGMPCISDPGAILARFMQENNLPYTIIPGPSSVLSVFALSGFEGKEFCFFGFLPHKLHDKKKMIMEILQCKFISIFFESPYRILNTLDLLSSLAPKRNIFIAKEITKIHEKFYFGKIEDAYFKIRSSNTKGEWVLALDSNNSLANNSPSNNSPLPSLSILDIENLSLPPKIKAKLLSLLSGKKTSECYENIINAKI